MAADRNCGSTLISACSTPQSLFGYEVIDLLGEGAGSLIYVVTDPLTHQLYALKHVVRKEDRDLRFVAQLEAEYEVGRLVRHAGLRRCVDLKIERTFLRKPTEAALVLELFDGRSLENALPATIPQVLEAFIKAADALHELHRLGYVHCDLKPNNILLNPSGAVKVIDLGQACRIGTVKERIQGTPDYIAPEQVRCEAVTVRTDIFNFGATMYWALTRGRKLPTLYTVSKTNGFLLDDQIHTPREINPLVPENLSAFVMHCVRTNPAKRPHGFAEVCRRLEALHHSLTRTPMDDVRRRQLLKEEEAAEAAQASKCNIEIGEISNDDRNADDDDDQFQKTAVPFGNDTDWFAE